MKKKLFFTSILALSMFFGIAQNNNPENSKGIIKIITVDENGKKTEVIKSLDDFNQDDMSEIQEQLLELQNISGDFKELSVFSTNGDNIEINIENDGNHYVIHKSIKHEGPFIGIHLDKVEKGIFITKIVEGSGAEKAGLLKGDILTSVNGNSLTEDGTLKRSLKDLKVGDRIKLDYLREGKSAKATVILGEYPKANIEREMIWVSDREDMMFSEDSEAYKRKMEEMKSMPFLGITPVDEAKDITGVMIFEVIEGSSAEKLGLQTGDVITEINRNSIESFSGLADVLAEMKPNDAITIKYKRDGAKKTVSGNLGSKADVKHGMPHGFKNYHFNSDKIVRIECMAISINDDELEMLSKKTGKDLTGSDKFDDVNIDLYPNPNTGEFKVKFETAAKDPITVNVYNVSGNEVYSENVNDFNGLYDKKIVLKDKTSGTYFLVITQNNKVITEKIILN